VTINELSKNGRKRRAARMEVRAALISLMRMIDLEILMLASNIQTMIIGTQFIIQHA
jgi:hypothetical protein